MTLAKLQRARRKVQTRITPYKCILGDASGQVYASEAGYYWARRYDRADANGNVTPGTPFRVRSGTALVVPRGGRQVWVGTGLDGHLTVLGFVHEDLTAPGVDIDPRAAQPNDPYRAWIRLKQIQNFRALPLATGATGTMKVQVRQLFYYTEEGDVVRYNGTNADTHIDLTDYVPADGLQRYVVLWLRTYNPNGLSDIQVTQSSAISSVDDDLSFDELQECADEADADTIPIQAFRLANAQTTLTLDDTIDVDLRQFIDMPQVYGFPNDVPRQYRIHENHSVLMPEVVTLSSGGGVQIQAGGVLVILDTDPVDSGEGGGGSGGMTSFDVAADSGTPATIEDGETVTFAGGTGLSSDISGNTVTHNLDNTAVAPGSYSNASLTVDAQGRMTAALHGQLKENAQVATTAALPACTYANGSSGVGATLTADANGALTVDSTTVLLGYRVLVKDQSTTLQNGIYECTQQGAGGAPFILTRATDADTSDELFGCCIPVRLGNVNANTLFLNINNTDPITIGTDAISFNATLSVSSSLTKSGSQIGLATAPNISSFSNANHDHSNSSNGGQLNASNVFASGTIPLAYLPKNIAIIADQKAANTAGGTSSSATWNARDMNTEIYDPDGLVTISSNKMVFIAGTYEFVIEAPFFGSTSGTTAQSRLFNVTDTAVVTTGQNITGGVSAGAVSIVRGTFTSDGSDEYRIDTYTTVGRATNGLGVQLNIGGTETYTYMFVRKIA